MGERAAMASETSIGSPMRYAIAIACVGLALAARFSLNPLFGDDNFVFTVFYLAVALIALFFRPWSGCLGVFAFCCVGLLGDCGANFHT